ncbi:MAG: Crp/Fnr family transcriptional regulator [Candidatus Daviesbacteria bacterium]|nr:Crp/Fnr family transcriptional regulator [Candidatus Daviesbacteria bacterium]
MTRELGSNGLVAPATVSGTEDESSNRVYPLKDQPFMKFPPGKILFRNGQAAERLFLVLDGIVTLTRYAGESDQNEFMELAVSPTLIGEESLVEDSDYESEAETLTTCLVQQIRPYNIVRILQDPVDSKSLFLAALRQSANIRQHPGLTKALSKVRIEALLQQLQGLNQRWSPFRRLNQGDLAKLAGISREGVNKEMAKGDLKVRWGSLQTAGKSTKKAKPKSS